MAQLLTGGWRAPHPPPQTEASSAPRTGCSSAAAAGAVDVHCLQC